MTILTTAIITAALTWLICEARHAQFEDQQAAEIANAERRAYAQGYSDYEKFQNIARAAARPVRRSASPPLSTWSLRQKISRNRPQTRAPVPTPRRSST